MDAAVTPRLDLDLRAVGQPRAARRARPPSRRAHALPLRVDAYLALNYDHEFLGDWYASREPGPVDDHLRVEGLKIHLDDGWGHAINWEPAELTATIGRANEAGWQVSVHAMSSAAMELVLDAFEAALGPTGPNPLHHRIEHAMQVTDEQLARLVAMDIAIVTHLDGANDWLLDDRVVAEFDRDDPGEQLPLLDRWRDFVDAGLHVASATDAPWTFEGQELLDAMGRPVDQIAAGMDGRVRTSPEVPAWSVDQLLTAEQGLRAVTARCRLGRGRRGAARPPGARHAGRRHDPERRRHHRPRPTRSGRWRSSRPSSAASSSTAPTRRSAPDSEADSTSLRHRRHRPPSLPPTQ